MFSRLAKLLLIALVPLAAVAQDAPPPAPAGGYSTYNRHFGFFIRPELGFGYFSSSASQGGTDATISGGGGVFALAIGGAVSENFIVAGQVWDYIASSPTLKVNGVNIPISNGSSAGVVGYGVLLNWYLQPSNLYIAVTPSFTKLVSSDGTSSETSEWGFGVRGAVGKEWWVSDHWGIGLAASLALSSNKFSGSGQPSWGSAAFGLTCSATYN
jgi:hypothetical protein